MLRWLLALWIGVLMSIPFTANADDEPAILLANAYRNQVDVTQYLVSEKLDGVRAVWDGRRLRFRSGKPIHAPAWFVDALPARPLDGELWIGHGSFERVSGIVRKEIPIDAEWRQVRYMVLNCLGRRDRFASVSIRSANWFTRPRCPGYSGSISLR